MNKMDVFKVLKEIQTSLPLGGSMNTNIKELISLVAQEYIIGEYVKVEDLHQPMYSVDNIYITNSGHDFIAYAIELMSNNIDFSMLSYKDIEKFGRRLLIQRLKLE